MSNVEGIPIYRDLMKLIRISMEIMPQTPKFNQITLGKYTIKQQANMLSRIIAAYRTNNAQFKVKCLKEFQIGLDEVESFFTIIFENSKLAKEKISRIDLLIDQLGKQSSAWLNSALT